MTPPSPSERVPSAKTLATAARIYDECDGLSMRDGVKVIALAIDAAVAEAVAEEREACALIVSKLDINLEGISDVELRAFRSSPLESIRSLAAALRIKLPETIRARSGGESEGPQARSVPPTSPEPNTAPEERQ